MDIGLLSQMLSKLLKDHDEVTLPGLGTLVTEFMPATFSDKGYTINPPFKKISLRYREAEDDSLLMEAYSEANGVTKDESEHIVNAFLSEIKDRLKEEKQVALPGLGRLRATKENHFFFVMDEDADIFPEGFGLERIHIKALSDLPERKDAAGADKVEISGLNGKAVEKVEASVEPETESVAESSHPEPEVEPAVSLETDPVKVKKHISPFWTIILIILGIAILALVALAILGRVAPDLVDRILYTAEELEILNS